MKTRVATFLLLSLVTLPACQNSDSQHSEPQPSEPRACKFSIDVEQLNTKSGNYERVDAIGEVSSAIPCSPFTPDLKIGSKLELQTTSRNRTTVGFSVTLNGEKRELDVSFDVVHDKKLIESFEDFDSGIRVWILPEELSPFVSDDSRLKKPVLVYIIEPTRVANPPNENYIQNYKIVSEQEIAEPAMISKTKSLLTDFGNYCSDNGSKTLAFRRPPRDFVMMV